MTEEAENLLYVKGMSSTEIEDVWDDTILNNAYDKALKIANVEVAKRVAMETNSHGPGKSKSKSKAGKGKANAETEASKPASVKSPKWVEGMPCCAVYEEDGLEYEAFITTILNKDDCIVKFIGYENTERVAISSLKPSGGNEARMVQLREAKAERLDHGFESQTTSDSVYLYSDGPSSPEPAEMPSNKKKKSNKKNKHRGSNSGDLPNIPMPDLTMFRNMDRETPLPPPPPLLSLSGSDAEQQAISDMLLSWYMTGYYTGLYQGMKRQKQSRRHH